MVWVAHNRVHEEIYSKIEKQLRFRSQQVVLAPVPIDLYFCSGAVDFTFQLKYRVCATPETFQTILTGVALADVNVSVDLFDVHLLNSRVILSWRTTGEKTYFLPLCNRAQRTHSKWRTHPNVPAVTASRATIILCHTSCVILIPS